jgi:NitT/TauT family transport system ATP-binding protein
MVSAATLGAARHALAAGLIRVDVRGKSFGEAPVLGGIAFEVAPGETVALVGPSGIGKSTLLRIVAGIDPEFDGEIIRPEVMAIVFQEPTLLPWRTAAQNLTLIHSGLTDKAAQDALDSVGLGDKATYFPGQLSLGQQRRLSLARAFVGQPELLIMDEPFASLDADTAETMLALTETLIAAHRPATLFVTHSSAEADRLAERVLVLERREDRAVLV